MIGTRRFRFACGPAEQQESTRALLARTIIVVVVLACAVLSLALLQRPLGITADALARAERVLGAVFLLAWPVTRFYFRRG